MIQRDEALRLLKEQGPEEHMIHHALETEAIMRALASRLERDAELWGLTGLLHDVDYPATKDNPFLTERRWYNKKLYTRRHNPLLVDMDERILDGSITLPGLPTSRDSHEGTWKPMAMYTVDGPVLPTDWLPDN